MPVIPVLTMLPLSATVIAGAFAIVLLNRFIGGKRRPHELMWAIAFLLFAIGAACQVYADVAGGWTSFLARTFYLTGAILNVGFLALGTVYLLFRGRPGHIVTALTMVLVVFAIYKTYTVPIDATALAQVHNIDYKQLFSVDTAPRWLAAVFSGVGSIVVIAGALWSGVVFWRKRIMKDRMIGVFLIAAGTLIVAMGGTLKGLFQNDDWFYPTMSIGVLVMFFGYLQTVRPAPAPASGSVPAGAGLKRNG
jgi:glucan phosphoethanolaminetransferase (alkaline phosphatase superfamily)